MSKMKQDGHHFIAHRFLEAGHPVVAVDNDVGMVFFQILIVVFGVIHIHEEWLQIHRADLDASAAADAVRILDVLILFLGEEEHAGVALDGRGLKAGGADAHHRAAEDDLARGFHEAAALLGDVMNEIFAACHSTILTLP